MNIIRSTVILAAATASLAWGASPKMAPDRTLASDNTNVDVIVRYRVRPQSHHHALVLNRGGRFKQSLELINSAAYSAPPAALGDLVNDPDVEYISPDRPVKGFMDVSEPTVNASIALKYGWDGTGITVAVIDSGIMDTHPDLQDSSGVSRAESQICQSASARPHGRRHR